MFDIARCLRAYLLYTKLPKRRAYQIFLRQCTMFITTKQPLSQTLRKSCVMADICFLSQCLQAQMRVKRRLCLTWNPRTDQALKDVVPCGLCAGVLRDLVARGRRGRRETGGER